MSDQPADKPPFDELLKDAKATIQVNLPTTGEGFLSLRSGRCAFDSATCPVDGENLMTVGLPSLAYTFEECECPRVPYTHLVEQLWHRGCLASHEVMQAIEEDTPE